MGMVGRAHATPVPRSLQLRGSDASAAPRRRMHGVAVGVAATTCILIRRLQVLEPLVLRYARGGARRDRARRLPNRTDL